MLVLGYICLAFLLLSGIMVIIQQARRKGASHIRLVHRPNDPSPYDVERKGIFRWRLLDSFMTQPAAEEFIVRHKAGTAVLAKRGFGSGTVLLEMKD
jgi:hypothetical protein